MYCSECGAALPEGAAVCGSCGSDVADVTAPPTLDAGSEIGNCRIETQIGRGGMGVVYRAVQLGLRRTVAVKVIAPEFAQNVDFRERFQRESRLAALIDHPNVITVHEAGEADGVLYLVMAYVEGVDLGTMLSRRGRLDPAVAVSVVTQVAAGLDAAHARGLVHRDVKPGNVLIASGAGADHVYLTDFGLTKHAASQSGVTKTGQWVGTLDYVAPEQIEGMRLDARADLYSLGCVLYQALTGHVPFERDTDMAKMWAHLNAPPPVPHALVAELAPFDDVIGRALAKDRDARYPSAGDLGRAAVAAAQGTVVTEPERSVATGAAAGLPTRVAAGDGGGPATPPPAQEDEPRGDGRRRSRTALAFGALVCAAVVAAILVLTGVLASSSRASRVQRAATRSLKLANNASDLTQELGNLTKRLNNNPSPSDRGQITAALERARQRALDQRNKAKKEQHTPGADNPDIHQANTLIIDIYTCLSGAGSDLVSVSVNPGSAAAARLLKDATKKAQCAADKGEKIPKYLNPHLPHAIPPPPPGPPVLRWSIASASPPLSMDSAQSVAYDPAAHRVVLFNGKPGAPCGAGAAISSAFVWNGSSWAATSTPPQLGGGQVGLAYDAARQSVVLLGSNCDSTSTYTWDGSSWTQANPAQSPPPLQGASMAYDPTSQRVVLFGGGHTQTNMWGNETWTWDGTNWSAAAPAHRPPPRYRPAMAPDPKGGGLLMYGGNGSIKSGEALRDTWRWTGTDWTELSADGGRDLPVYLPGEGGGPPQMVADSTRGEDVLLASQSPLGPGETLWRQFSWNGSSWRSLMTPTVPDMFGLSLAVFDGDHNQILALGRGDQNAGAQPQAWTGVETTGQQPTPPVGLTGARLSLDGLGPIKFGMSTSQALAASQGQLKVLQIPNSLCNAILGPTNGPSDRRGDVAISIGSKGVFIIDVSSKAYPTDRGVRVGDTIDAMRRAYGRDLRSIGASTPFIRGPRSDLGAVLDSSARITGLESTTAGFGRAECA